MSEHPLYEHDCKRCTFLGNFNAMDLYYCVDSAHGMSTVIARWSSHGPDYKSGLVFCGNDPELAMAFRRARTIQVETEDFHTVQESVPSTSPGRVAIQMRGWVKVIYD